MKFDFDFFKKGSVYVAVKTNEELESFLNACRQNGMVWKTGGCIDSRDYGLENYFTSCIHFSFDIFCGGLAWQNGNNEKGLYVVNWDDFISEYPCNESKEKINIQATQSFINIPIMSKLNGRLYNLISYVGKNEEGEEIVLVQDLGDGKLLTAPLNNFKGIAGKKRKQG